MSERGFNAFRVLCRIAPGAAVDVDNPYRIGLVRMLEGSGKPDVNCLQATGGIAVAYGRDVSGVCGGCHVS